jgi:hypothetical protein
VLIRRDEPRLMEQAIEWPGRLVYLVDDDVDGAARSPSLPAGYRERLARLSERYLDRLVRRADTIVVSSEPLLHLMQADQRIATDIRLLDPFWDAPLAGQDHFASMSADAIEMIHLGTASHRGGLAAIVPAVVELLETFPNAHFSYIGRKGDHPALDTCARARRIGPMSWGRYRRWLPKQRFHLALYPLEDTPFDRARSINKLIEHAIVGAVGVYPEHWTLPGMTAGGTILAPTNLGNWGTCLRDAMANPMDLRQRAHRAASALAPWSKAATQQAFWATLLDRDSHDA